MKILATVAARGGSKGIKNKNIKDLAGKPLIVYTIEQIKRWGKFERFIVSTDSEKIADIARQHGVEVPFIRPAELSGDDVGKSEVLRHALMESEKRFGIKFDALIDLDVTAPVRTVADIDNAVNLFLNKKPDCVFSVVKARRNPYFNMVEIKPDGTAALCKQPISEVVSRQSAPPVYEMNASIYVYSRDFLLDPTDRISVSSNAFAYEMDEASRIDIDSEIDFTFVEYLIKEGIVKL